MFLNTSSKVRVNYGQRERLVTLEEGEAYFSVAQDTKRPFVVAAGEHRLRTSHGSFRVLKLAEKPVDILVNKGAWSWPRAQASRLSLPFLCPPILVSRLTGPVWPPGYPKLCRRGSGRGTGRGRGRERGGK